MKITNISNCQCGAITIIFDNGASNSMCQDTFEQLNLDIQNAEWLPDSYCCDHCVNHWALTCVSVAPVNLLESVNVVL